jgi:hypothetical protein
MEVETVAALEKLKGEAQARGQGVTVVPEKSPSIEYEERDMSPETKTKLFYACYGCQGGAALAGIAWAPRSAFLEFASMLFVPALVYIIVALWPERRST